MDRTNPAPKEPPMAARPEKQRAYLKQSDVPEFPFAEALRIPRAIAEQYGKQPTRPADVALALDLLPSGRQFKGLSGSAVAYDLTDGAAQAELIGLTDLGRRIVAPTIEGDDMAAMREAFLKPRVIREFLSKYDTSTLPTDERIAQNVLETMGVPATRTADTFQLIVTTAESLGLLTEVRGRKVVNLRATTTRLHIVTPPEDIEEDDGEDAVPLPASVFGGDNGDELPAAVRDASEMPDSPQRNRRVFVSHGSNQQIVQHLKELLEYGEYEPVVSVERETTSKPVPEKVLDDMRSCAAGIIHVGVEKVITDSDGEEHPQLNSNVLIEIGAAMALYGRNFILLVEDETKLPSNLQGLYEVRYEGKSMDARATMKLLKAFKDFKS
jgi:Predicted nucleotide-binding protein containing TIR-like domain